MLWTSRIALIAYLLGGWLLPAAHHHAHHQQGACRHVVEATLHAHSDHGGCCPHGHDHQHETETDTAALAADLNLAQAPTLPVCDGLCALCSARSLTTTPLKQKPTSVPCGDSFLTEAPTEPEFPPASPAREHLSRGPPAIA